MKEIDIRNGTFCNSDDIIKSEAFDFDFLIDKKSYDNIYVYNISCKILIVSKPLYNWCGKVDGFIGVYNGTRYLVLFFPEKYDAIYNMLSYFISKKSGIKFIFVIITEARFIWCFASRKTLTLHNVMILIKLVFNKNQNHYDYNIFL